MKRELGQLATFALDQLWAQEEDCCQRCCHPCSALMSLWLRGELDNLVEPLAEGSPWWDVQAKWVDREWLAPKIMGNNCPNHKKEITE